MAERYFDLSKEDQNEVLEQARARTGRPAHLLEKDLWVVWTLGALFESPFAAYFGECDRSFRRIVTGGLSDVLSAVSVT